MKAKLAIASLFLFSIAAFAAVRVGETAPDFTATDTNGNQHTLAQYKGKFVVLEWNNRDCPYTVKHYDSGNMQKLQKEWTSKGVIWLTVISSAPGQQGYLTAEQGNEHFKKVGAAPTAVLLDPKGDLGHLYGAKTTPHMFVINPQRQLVYDGAIDDKPTTEQSDVTGAKNFVTAALDEATSGKTVEVATSRPYGCSVKYAK